VSVGDNGKCEKKVEMTEGVSEKFIFFECRRQPANLEKKGDNWKWLRRIFFNAEGIPANLEKKGDNWKWLRRIFFNAEGIPVNLEKKGDNWGVTGKIFFFMPKAYLRT
jgi:hypothetical protein